MSAGLTLSHLPRDCPNRAAIMSRRPRTCPRTDLSFASASPSARPFPTHGELLAGVLALLDPLLLLRARLVCAEWCHVISSSRHLWQRVVERQVALADRARSGAGIAMEKVEGGNAERGNAEVRGGAASGEGNRLGGGEKKGAAGRGAEEGGGKAGSGGGGREPGRGEESAEGGSGGEEVEGMGSEGVRTAVGMAVGAEQRRRYGRGEVRVCLMRGHTRGRVNGVAMRHGAVATGGSDDCVRLWQVPALPALPSPPSSHRSAASSAPSPPSALPACRQTACFPSPAAQPITAVDLTDIMVLAASGTQVFAWNKETGKLLRSFGGHHQRVRTMSYDDTDLLAACSDGTVHVYDIYSGTTTHILRPHARARGGATAMSYSGSMGLLLSGGTDGTVRLTDCRSSLQLHTLLVTDPSPVTSVLLSVPSNRVMAASASGHLRVWDLSPRILTATFSSSPSHLPKFILSLLPCHLSPALPLHRSPARTLMDIAISPPTHTTLALPSSPLALPPVLLTAGATGLVQILDAASLAPLRRLSRPPLAELALGGGAGVAVEVDRCGGAGEGQGSLRLGSGQGMREGGEDKGQGQSQVARGSRGVHASIGENGAAAGVSSGGVSGGAASGVTGIAARTSTFVTSHVDGTGTLWFAGL
ncbi:unnamed protein product [Closterium sp. Yama58-4]|nr:unnamed protein product [Closterium sp. Yama58-4]